MTADTTISTTINAYYTLTTLNTTITNTGAVIKTDDFGTPVVYGPSGTAWTLDNAGVIMGGVSYSPGVNLVGGGYVYNQGTGAISGANGILIQGGVGTVTNQGSITGSAKAGVILYDGGTIANDVGAQITGSYNGVFIHSGAAAVTNSGTITGTGTFGYGVVLYPGGSVTNMAGAVITANAQGISMHGVGTVTNYGTIESPFNHGIKLYGGGVVTNGAGGTITGGSSAVYISNGAGTVTNSGSIMGYIGVVLYVGGNITNTASGLIQGIGKSSDGVVVHGIGTVTNAGTLTGEYLALQFAGSYANRLVVIPGAVFNGGVAGYSTPSANTLELASGSSIGTLNGLGTNFAYFGNVIVDADANWQVLTASGTGTISISAGADLALDGPVTSTQAVTFLNNTGILSIANPDAFGATVYGLQSGDVIDFTTLSPGSDTITAGVSSSHLMVFDGSTTLASIAVDPNQNFTGLYFDAVASGGSIVVTGTTTPCFCAGTRIRTVRGDVAVEDLKEGDLVVTASGRQRPIRWIGRRSYKGYFIRGNRDVLPIRIKAGALADNVPSRDLMVSPLHAMLLDGMLIPAFKLVNGVTVEQVQDVDAIHYFHIELATHDILLAEDAPTESFVDDDSRDLFHNAPEYWAKHPRQPWRPARFCAPRIENGYELEEALHPVLVRAGLRHPGSSPYGDPLGELRGWVEECRPDRIAGWAQNMEFPHAGVVLSIFLGDEKLADVMASKQRADLEEAGIGDGRHGFEYRPKQPIPPARLHTVRVVRAMDRTPLPGQTPQAVAA